MGRLTVAGRTLEGPAIDLRPLVAGGEGTTAVERTLRPAQIAAVIRRQDGERTGSSDLDCEFPLPGPVHDHVGCVVPGLSLSLPAAIAAAARSRGARAPQDAEVAALERERAAIAVPDVDLAAARRAVAAASEDVESRRERVARLGGQVEARATLDADPETARAEHEAAAGDLAAAETELVAAEQRLARERERARKARDARERRLALTDRIENLQRAARRSLARKWADPFREAVSAVPSPDGRDGATAATVDTLAFDGDDVTAALAVARLAAMAAPVVLAAGRFADARAARFVLDAPVVCAPPPDV